jgi:hypothetical protein
MFEGPSLAFSNRSGCGVDPVLKPEKILPQLLVKQPLRINGIRVRRAVPSQSGTTSLTLPEINVKLVPV